MLDFETSFEVSINMYKHDKVKKRTWVRLVVGIGPGRGSSVAGLHLQGIRPLLLPVEHYLGEDLPGLHADLEEILALVTRRIHDVVINLGGKVYSY